MCLLDQALIAAKKSQGLKPATETIRLRGRSLPPVLRQQHSAQRSDARRAHPERENTVLTCPEEALVVS
jgi:hypothetical protein